MVFDEKKFEQNHEFKRLNDLLNFLIEWLMTILDYYYAIDSKPILIYIYFTNPIQFLFIED